MSTATLTEDAVRRLAPDDDTFRNAGRLANGPNYSGPGVSADGSWLLSPCKGSGSKPYEVSVDLADPDRPTFRCNCPSRKFPCKHSLGLLLKYALHPDKFTAREPDEALQAKREKKSARDTKKAGHAVNGAAAPAAKKPNGDAQKKKAAAQRDALELLEKLALDLVAGGNWDAKAKLDKLDRQAKSVVDGGLLWAAPRYAIRRFLLYGRDTSLTEDQKLAGAADALGELWAIVQRGRAYLDNRLAAGEDRAEADAVMEIALGKAWHLKDLKEAGYTRPGLRLFELAWEGTDDAAAEQRVEVSHLLELSDGTLYQAISYRPFKGMKLIPEQPSYPQPIAVAEAAVYPGFLNRRVRWEKGTEKPEPLGPAHLKAAFAKAQPSVKAAVELFRGQIKNTLAPREATFLLRAAKVGRLGDKTVLQDADGVCLELCDCREGYSHVATLGRAAGMFPGRPVAVLVKMFTRPWLTHVLATPLAVVTPDAHLRLGF